MLCVLKIPTGFGVVPQSFCQNQNPVQDQDQDHLDFNTRPTFHTQKTPTKFCLDPLTPSKVIVSTAKVHLQPARQTDGQTDGNFFCLFCVLRHTKHEHSSKGENFFSIHAITILSLFTYSVCDEKVQKILKTKIWKKFWSFEKKMLNKNFWTKNLGKKCWEKHFR